MAFQQDSRSKAPFPAGSVSIAVSESVLAPLSKLGWWRSASSVALLLDCNSILQPWKEDGEFTDTCCGRAVRYSDWR